MPPATNPPRLASEAVHDKLRRAILSGAYAADETLPSERELSAKHRVNRHAVREAIKRLQQSGLVQVTPGGATRVLDWRTTGGLELLTDVAGTATAPQPLLRAVAEMRASLGADAARLCAARADEEGRAEIRQLGAALRDPAEYRRYQHRFGAYEALWARIVEGSDNLAYRLAFNSLVSARNNGGIDPRAFAGEVDDRAAGRALAEAIAAGDQGRAEALARELLERTVRALGG